MRFVCDENKFGILEMTAVELGVEYPALKKFVEIEDAKLITIARTLGMEELAPAISNEEAMLRLGIDPPIEVHTVGDKKPWLLSTSEMPACEICGQPVKSKRAKICSDECAREKQRRYARKYYHRKDKTTEDAGGVLPPLPPEGEETCSIRSDPGDEPVRVAGL